jgi:hypothetical protein
MHHISHESVVRISACVLLALSTDAACFLCVGHQIAERVREAVKKEMKHVNEMLVHITPGKKSSHAKIICDGANVLLNCAIKIVPSSVTVLSCCIG